MWQKLAHNFISLIEGIFEELFFSQPSTLYSTVLNNENGFGGGEITPRQSREPFPRQSERDTSKLIKISI